MYDFTQFNSILELAVVVNVSQEAFRQLWTIEAIQQKNENLKKTLAAKRKTMISDSTFMKGVNESAKSKFISYLEQSRMVTFLDGTIEFLNKRVLDHLILIILVPLTLLFLFLSATGQYAYFPDFPKSYLGQAGLCLILLSPNIVLALLRPIVTGIAIGIRYYLLLSTHKKLVNNFSSKGDIAKKGSS